MTPKARPRLSVADLMLIAAGLVCAVNLLVLVFDYGNLGVHAGYMEDTLPIHTRSGAGLHWADFRNLFDELRNDMRPRFFPMLLQLFDAKLRLWLLRFGVPHPTFTIIWLLTLGLAPALLYRFLLDRTGDRRTAWAVVILYLSSIGVLSGVVVFLLHAKLLTIAVYVFAIYSASRARDARKAGELLWQIRSPHRVVVPAVMLAGLFVDETPGFLFLFLPVMFPELFLGGSPRNWRRIAGNALVFLSPIPLWLWLCELIRRMAGVTAPYFTAQFTGGSGHASMLGFFFHTFEPATVATNLLTYFTLFLAPLGLIPYVMEYRIVAVPKAGFGELAFLSLFALLVWSVARRMHPDRRSLLLASLACGGGYVVLLSLVHFLHMQITNGAYYGSALAVFTSIAGALLYSGIPERRKAWGAAFVLWVCVVQVLNSRIVNGAWAQHHHKTFAEDYWVMRDTVSFPIREPSLLTRQELQAMRQAWLANRLDEYLRANGSSSAALYFIWELRAAGKGW